MIKNNVSDIIGKRKLSVAEVAKIAGVKYSTIQNLYKDKTKKIEFETMDKLCYALECSTQDLFPYIPD